MSATVAPAQPSIASVGDYIELMKPRVMSLVVFTAFVGLMIAPGHLHPVIAITALLCIAVGAGAAGALNMWYDADIDARMERTAGRPVPAGRVAPGEALAFGVTLAGFSVVVLGLLVNVVAGALLAADDRLLCAHLHDVAQTLDAAEYRHRRRRRRAAAGHRLGFGNRRAWPLRRCSFSSSSSSGRRRTSGRCRSIAPRIMPAPAYRCCRSSPAKRKHAAKSCSIRCCLPRSARRHGSWAMPDRSMASSRVAAGAVMVALALRLRRERRRLYRQQADVRLLAPLSVSVVCHAAGRLGGGGAVRPFRGMTSECD